MLSKERLRLSLVVRDDPRRGASKPACERSARHVPPIREKRDGALHFDVGTALHFGNAAAR